MRYIKLEVELLTGENPERVVVPIMNEYLSGVEGYGGIFRKVPGRP